MTTSDIENAANPGGLATPDFPLKSILRYKVIPEFLIDVGDVAWVRRTGTIQTVAGTRDYALASDFLRFRQIGVPSDYPMSLSDDRLQYVGENDDLVLSLENAVGQSAPKSYWVINSSSEFKTVRLAPTPDAAYTFPYSYIAFMRFKSAEEVRDLSTIAPEPLHWAFVEGLKREVFVDRFGEGDPRYMRAEAEYRSWIGRANRMDMREPGSRGSHRVYAR